MEIFLLEREFVRQPVKNPNQQLIEIGSYAYNNGAKTGIFKTAYI